jgi:hypothetical protein
VLQRRKANLLRSRRRLGQPALILRSVRNGIALPEDGKSGRAPPGLDQTFRGVDA